MYQIGDILVYENGGVCEVVAIGTPDFLKSKESYYTLQPVFDNAGTLYVKVENDRHILRPLISRDEADGIFAELPDMEPMYNSNDKLREREFKEAVRSCECRQWFAMLKGISQEEIKREERGKKLSMSDDRNMQKVFKLLSSEFALVYSISLDEAKDKIKGAIA
jgi:CarD family transcriptional regulator